MFLTRNRFVTSIYLRQVCRTCNASYESHVTEVAQRDMQNLPMRTGLFYQFWFVENFYLTLHPGIFCEILYFKLNYCSVTMGLGFRVCFTLYCRSCRSKNSSGRQRESIRNYSSSLSLRSSRALFMQEYLRAENMLASTNMFKR